MTNEQLMVRDFMSKFQQERYDKPTVPSLECRKLRASLMLEEVLETIAAMGVSVMFTNYNGDSHMILYNGIPPLIDKFTFEDDGKCDLVEVADGLADQHYVGYCGTGEAFGIDMEPIMKEVHRSNMSKLWTEEDLKKTKELYPDAKVYEFGGGLYYLRRPDGKQIKSPSYSPANIKAIIKQQQGA